jgi:hypothetical protein
VPALAAARRGGWRHIESVLYEKRGIVFEEGERVVTGLALPDAEKKPRGEVGVLHVRRSRCGGRLRAGSYVLPVGVAVICEG